MKGISRSIPIEDVIDLFKILDPNKLDIARQFVLKDYLEPFLASVSIIINIEVIILRRKLRIKYQDTGIFEPVAWVGVEDHLVENAIVTIKKPLVMRLAGIEPPGDVLNSYFVLDAKTGEDFGQKEFALEADLNQGYAFSICIDRAGIDIFDGFIIYFTKGDNDFSSEQKDKIPEINKFIEHTFLYADALGVLQEEQEELRKFKDTYGILQNARLYNNQKEFIVSSLHNKVVATNYFRLGEYKQAGDAYRDAAEALRNIDVGTHTMVEIEECYRSTKRGIRYGFHPQYLNEYFKLIDTLDRFPYRIKSLCEDLYSNLIEYDHNVSARNLYIYKMDKLRKFWKKGFIKVLWWFWRVFNKYSADKRLEVVEENIYEQSNVTHSEKVKLDRMESYARSASNYIMVGNENDFVHSYENFRELIDSQEKFTGKHEFLFNYLIKKLTENGFNEHAHNLYIYKMDKIRMYSPKRHRKLVLSVWRATSNYGESWWKLAFWASVVILSFAGVYFIGENCIISDWKIVAACSNRTAPLFQQSFVNDPGSFGTCLSFSMAVFASFGFGDIVPNNIAARIIVGLEVFFGYAILGIFITIVSRRVVRR